MEITKVKYSKDRKCMWITLKSVMNPEEYIVLCLILNAPASWSKSGDNLVIRQDIL